jgi:hypothetical protein
LSENEYGTPNGHRGFDENNVQIDYDSNEAIGEESDSMSDAEQSGFESNNLREFSYRKEALQFLESTSIFHLSGSCVKGYSGRSCAGGAVTCERAHEEIPAKAIS